MHLGLKCWFSVVSHLKHHVFVFFFLIYFTMYFFVLFSPLIFEEIETL